MKKGIKPFLAKMRGATMAANALFLVFVALTVFNLFGKRGFFGVYLVNRLVTVYILTMKKLLKRF